MKIVLEIQSLGHRAIGIGRHEGKVVMVPFCAPGDRLEVEILKSHKSYDEARLLRVLEPSAQRQDPPCPYFGKCGGCQLQHIAIAHQRFLKERILRDFLQAQAGVPGEKMLPILADPMELGYRCRLDLHVLWEDLPRLAFASWGSSKLFEVHECLLAMETLKGCFSEARELLSKAPRGAVRRVEMACDGQGPGKTFFFSVSGLPPSGSFQDLRSRASTIEGLRALCIGRGVGNKARTLWRSSDPWEGIWIPACDAQGKEFHLEVWPGVFTQVNPRMNRMLTQTVASWAEELAPKSILDVYAGMGNLSFAVSPLASRVTALEVNPRAVANGLANAHRLGVENLTWICGSAQRELLGMISKGQRFQLVILDPPRSGAMELLEALASLRPEAVIYVSCEPSTLARDLNYLQSKAGYKVEKVQPLDMFPQTFHLESISLLMA
ncbi:MAG: class I SAM-dependent RNA methyltransferase [bacterium]